MYGMFVITDILRVGYEPKLLMLLTVHAPTQKPKGKQPWTVLA